MKKIKINFYGFWDKFNPEDNILINALRKNYNIDISNNPDFVFCSWFSKEPFKFKKCIKIFYSYENRSIDFKYYDYAIGLNRLPSKYFWSRNFYLRHCNCPVISTENRKNLPVELAHRKFCNFIYQNQNYGNNVENRKIFCRMLQQYKHVDCPGLVLNNMKNVIVPNNHEWEKYKLDFLKNYKFTIAFENSIADGYSTEKINHSFMVNSIPIYSGNPEITKDYNPKAFINVSDYKNFNEVIEKIIELDNDDEMYMQMLREPVYIKEPDYDAQLEKFLCKIIRRGNNPIERYKKHLWR